MKLGPHVQNFDRLDFPTLVSMKPPILKSLQPHPHIRDYKKEVGGLVIARSYVPDIDGQIGTGDSVALAGAMKGKLLTDWAAYLDVIDYFELTNETAQTGDALKHLTDFSADCCRHMHMEGHKVAVGSFSVGNPPDLANDWVTFRPAVRAADAVALHEYGAPRLWSEPGNAGPVVMGKPNAGDVGWWTLRYRRVRQLMEETYLFEQVGWHLPPFIITELGVDYGLTGGGQRGYKTGMSADDYVKQLDWYNQEIELDDYVLGATVFGYGMDKDWATYDLAYVKPFEDYMRAAA